MKQRLHRPKPIRRPRSRPVDQRTPPADAATLLRDGVQLLITDHYRTGARILTALDALLDAPAPDADYETRRDSTRTHRAAALRLLAPIKGHRLDLDGARHGGFLRELYPELPSFLLPLVQVQELQGAWERYEEGLPLTVLGHRLHPFYGTYVPARRSHLELFGTWLSQYQGPRSRAVDVGTGCGVLALMLCKAGFERVLATDNNPNAIESVRRELRRLPEAPSIELWHGDLLDGDGPPADLIVFNPPWIPGVIDGLLDRALYFEDGLFERFFDQAHARITPGGRIVLLFSNVITLLLPDAPHPILTELTRGRLRLVQKLQRKVKPAKGKGGRRRTRERVEVWELEITR